MQHPSLAYLPVDRVDALAHNQELPSTFSGSLLSLDISGFTWLTEQLTATLGTRLGADALTEMLNQVYNTLIEHLESWGGNVISFSGDGLLCWFEHDDGRGALACSLAIQLAMQQFSTTGLRTNAMGTIAIKAAIASGTVRRFRIGDEAIQYIDTLAGALLTRISTIEQLLQPGEVIIDQTTALALDSVVSIREWREHPQALISGAIVDQLTVAVAALPALQRTAITANRDHVQSWILPAVRERLEQGTGEFLTELRPAVALFGCFGGLNYDDDPVAEVGLNRYIGWVQGVIARYEGIVLQLTIGDKGSYFYAAFGAPLAHEDDALRAVLAARDLQTPPAELGLGQRLQVGISSGIMRTGAYGSTSRRTYGVLGDAVNLAARLMQHAGPNEILVSVAIQQSTAEHIQWQRLDDLTVKGKTEPVRLYRYAASLAKSASLPHAALYQLPLIGRAKELQEIGSYLAAAQNGHGQVIGVTGEAGIGKSRLISAVTQAIQPQQWRVYGAECQSYSRNTPYSIWQPIWRAIFGINSADPPATQLASLEAAIARIDPALLLRLPLLAPVVNLTIAETELTGSFDAQLRNASREALLVDWFRAWVQTQLGAATGLLLIVEDVQWIDPLSASLLIALGRVIEALPVAFVLGYRPFDPTAASLNPISQLSSLREVTLFALPEADTSKLVAARLAMLAITLSPEELATLVTRIIDRTQGNLFYIEELLTYLHSQQHDLHAAAVWESGELPTSLHNLILSRIDQLSTSQQTAIKVASVIGRLFRVAWLSGYYPAFNEPAELQTDLEQLHSANLIVQDAPDPELAYIFKHVITQEVAYESLAFPTRALLHEQFARYLEHSAAPLDNQTLYRVAYHYERSNNQPKTIEYLHRAAKSAQATYANEDAIGYYNKLMPLITDKSLKLQALLGLIDVLDIVGKSSNAEEPCRMALEIAKLLDDLYLETQCLRKLGWILLRLNKTEEAFIVLDRSKGNSISLNQQMDVCKINTDICNVLMLQWKIDLAQNLLTENLTLARSIQDNHSLAVTLLILGEKSRILGELQVAEEYSSEGLVFAKISGDQTIIANLLNSLGNIYCAQEKFNESLHILNDCIDICKRIGNKHVIARCYETIGRVYYESENYSDSEIYFQKSLSAWVDINNVHGIGTTIIVRAHFNSLKGNCSLAAIDYKRGIQIQRPNSRFDLYVSLLAAVRTLIQNKEFFEAWSLLQEGLPSAVKHKDKIRIGNAIYNYIYLVIISKSIRINIPTMIKLFSYAAMILTEVYNQPYYKTEKDYYDSVKTLIRNGLDEDSFATAWAEGQLMTMEEALEYILAGPPVWPEGTPDIDPSDPVSQLLE